MKKTKNIKTYRIKRDPYFTNNYRKLHGMPMRRIVHLEKLAIQRERRIRMEYIRRDVEMIGQLYTLGRNIRV